MSWLSSATSATKPWKAIGPSEPPPAVSKKKSKQAATSSDRAPWESRAAAVTSLELWKSTKSTPELLPWETTGKSTEPLPWVSQSIVIRFIKDDIRSLGGTPMTLLPCGSLQPTNLMDAIIATVVSIAATVGGLAMIVLSCGAATPGVIAGWGAAGGGMLGIGVSGTVNAGTGIHNRSFQWEQWGIEIGFAGVTSLITFPTCFFSGTAITAALVSGTRLSIGAAKSVAVAVGCLAGGGIHEGSCFIKCHVEGGEPEILELVLSGIGGMLEGGGAGYLAARIHRANVLATAEISEFNHQIRILKGIHRGDHSGFGAEHMLRQHGGAEILGVADNPTAFSKEMKKIIENGPLGYVIKKKYVKPVYAAPRTRKYFAVGISDSPCMLVQMNRVSRKEIKWICDL